jgi:S-adenosylmethionine:tRNA ribosyltransferase-isomerase
VTAVSEFDFDLPGELIAQQALPRGESRLLVLSRLGSGLTHTHVRNLPAYLRPGDLLVANDTRVFPARLLGHRVPSGGAVECLLLARDAGSKDPAEGGSTSNVQHWSALVHPGQKLKPGARVRFEGSAGVLMAEILDRQFFGRRRISLWAERGADVDTLVDALGHVPLPPYIHRPDTAADRERYQTVFAAHRGSIAAPTAGLHFDDRILADLARGDVERVTVTLHVGYGTFKPVRTEIVEEHVVDPEPYEIGVHAAARINAALDEGRRVIAVGTTTTRALEDAAQRGGGRVSAGPAQGQLFIHPGFEFRVISGLLTNFHLPRSSLLMLVSAFAGRERVLAAYREAVERRYRFYSYGDAMLIA